MRFFVFCFVFNIDFVLKIAPFLFFTHFYTHLLNMLTGRRVKAGFPLGSSIYFSYSQCVEANMEICCPHLSGRPHRMPTAASGRVSVLSKAPI